VAQGTWPTSLGKQFILEARWPTADPLKVGLLATTQPAALDSKSEVEAITTVSSLLAVATEATFTNYARQALTGRTQTLETPTSSVVLSGSDYDIREAGGIIDNLIVGAFVYSDLGSDASSIVLLVDWFTTPVLTAGGPFTYDCTSYVRVT